MEKGVNERKNCALDVFILTINGQLVFFFHVRNNKGGSNKEKEKTIALLSFSFP